MEQWIITRDGRKVAGPFETESAAFGQLLRLQPQSTDWAMRYEGWDVKRTWSGYASEETLRFEEYAPNVQAIYDALVALGAECLRRVPNMTTQTLGRNIKDNAQGVALMAAEGEPLRFLGWGDAIEIPESSRRAWVELGETVGDWHRLSEEDLGESWREVCQEKADRLAGK